MVRYPRWSEKSGRRCTVHVGARRARVLDQQVCVWTCAVATDGQSAADVGELRRGIGEGVLVLCARRKDQGGGGVGGERGAD
jgi:hypothetical protein